MFIPSKGITVQLQKELLLFGKSFFFCLTVLCGVVKNLFVTTQQLEKWNADDADNYDVYDFY